MIHFFDSSVFVKRYIAEAGSDLVRAAMRKPHVGISRIAQAEVPAALARAYREGIISATQRDTLLDRFEEDLRELTIVELRATTTSSVRGLVVRHPLRAYDAVQLASALALRKGHVPLTFWAPDGVLCDAAEAEGLRVMRVRV